jgi:cell wall assembly regulator SMI1
VKATWWNPFRLPLTDNGGGDPVTLDLDPAEDGDNGQILRFNHEVGPIKVIAGNFGEWLERVASDLESGELAYSDMELQVQPVNWDD